MLVNFAFKSFPGRAAAEHGASVLASPLHALEESLCNPPGRAGAPMGVVRAPSRGAGGPSQGSARWAEAARAAPRARHHRLALSWPLSHQGPVVAALTKAKACVPLLSLRFDPSTPVAVGVVLKAGSSPGQHISFGPGQQLNGFSGDR
ncbi:uncharacterized protein LOC113948878 isoform X2 [Corapipo altera]|uniref:uncharacterized protein LOC113948878 isoform X2 n=1 Tax=Corapipo altera TaxID=415028 RepID=UPI000FD63C08|nr:uncharacterized protein LOC113948878 isoform X2 [Corapipo altera]